ncbi:MAG: hypothetical protein ABW079_15265 [Sedimenticola sp.]
MISNTRTLLVSLLALLGTGCSMVAPHYTPSMDNVQILKNSGDFSASVGDFESRKDNSNNNPISLRGSSLSSPYDSSYSAYLREAIKQELSLAGKLKQGTDIEISGALRSNDIDTSGFTTATGDIEARFIVKQNNSVRYDEVKKIHLEWESSFAGAVAIPRAQQKYPELVQKLLSALYADKEFLKALR